MIAMCLLERLLVRVVRGVDVARGLMVTAEREPDALQQQSRRNHVAITSQSHSHHAAIKR